MEEKSKRFRLQRSDSYLIRKLVGRSMSSRLVLESVSSAAEWAPLPVYERLSHSMRFFGEPAPERNQNQGLRKFLGRVFAKKGSSTKEKEKKRWAAWLPDPERRWPVQGW